MLNTGKNLFPEILTQLVNTGYLGGVKISEHRSSISPPLVIDQEKHNEPLLKRRLEAKRELASGLKSEQMIEEGFRATVSDFKYNYSYLARDRHDNY